MKDEGSNSMIITFKQKLQQYDLPSIGHLMDTTPKKTEWKTTVKKQVMKAAKQYVENLAAERSTLKYLNRIFTPNQPHIIVRSVANHRQVTRSNIKARLATGTYPLQSTLHTMKKAANDLCPLCHKEKEDHTHFLLNCVEIQSPLSHSLLSQLMSMLLYTMPIDNSALTQLILDSSHPSVQPLLPKPHDVEKLEKFSRDYIYHLHLARTQKIQAKLKP